MDICTCLLAALFALSMAGKPLLDVSTSKGKEVQFKELKDKAKFVKPPTVKFQGASQGKKYALFMVDPDVPGYQENSGKYWLHWLVVDIEGEDMKSGGFSQATTLEKYAGPTPPAGKNHRYQFFLYEQPDGFNPEEPKNRGNFMMRDYVVRNGLAKSFEDYVASFYFLSAH